MTVLLLVPFGALVGFISWNVLKKGMKAAIKESDPLAVGNGSAEAIRAKDRAEARALYERIVMEKLDVVKTAIAMGYDKQEIRNLDSRLEELVGSEKLQSLLNDDLPVPRPDGENLDGLTGKTATEL